MKWTSIESFPHILIISQIFWDIPPAPPVTIVNPFASAGVTKQQKPIAYNAAAIVASKTVFPIDKDSLNV